MRIAPADAEERTLRLPPRARIVPIASVMLACALPAMLPVVAKAPILPPFGLLVLLGWRLLRPELWQAWIGLPLGLWDDLFSGQPMGSAAALWTIVLLVMDFTENRTVWRDYWHDLLTAAAAIAFCLLGGWLAAGAGGGAATLPLLLPQFALSLLAMPIAVRMVARLDRFRLAR